MDEARAPLAYALGDGGLLPFLGHFRVEVRGPASVLRVAGRRAAGASVVDAHQAAAAIERALTCVVDRAVDAGNRHALLRALWQVLTPGDTLKEEIGDLGLVAIAADREGVSLSGVGLVGAWYQLEGRAPRPLVPPEHPLLQSPLGAPSSLPGAMTLGVLPELVVVEVKHPTAPARGLPAGDLRAACGVRA